MKARPRWRFGDGSLTLDVPRVMGILNVTPDSFSDGGELRGVDDAVDRAARMVRSGADLLDVGGESTRPGADPVGTEEEVARVVPVIEALVGRFDLPVSVDTRKSDVARLALAAGAEIVNDVSGLAHDPGMGTLVAESGAGLVLMHMRGDPSDMREHTTYRDLLGEVVEELGDAVHRARGAGVEDGRIVVDPGIGFAKTAPQSLLVLRELGRLAELGLPILIGPSRKSFLGHVLGVPPRDRVTGTAAACVLGYLEGARIFRVHDIEPVAHALRVAHAVREGC